MPSNHIAEEIEFGASVPLREQVRFEGEGFIDDRTFEPGGFLHLANMPLAELKALAAKKGPLQKKGEAERISRRYWFEKEYDAAAADAQAFVKTGADGGGRARYILSKAYQYGRGGLAKDEAQALRHVKEAAAAGYANAQFELGAVHGKGLHVCAASACSKVDLGMAQDDSKRMAWYKRAAAQGHSAACGELGRFTGTAGNSAVVARVQKAAGITPDPLVACVWLVLAGLVEDPATAHSFNVQKRNAAIKRLLAEATAAAAAELAGAWSVERYREMLGLLDKMRWAGLYSVDAHRMFAAAAAAAADELAKLKSLNQQRAVVYRLEPAYRYVLEIRSFTAERCAPFAELEPASGFHTGNPVTSAAKKYFAAAREIEAKHTAQAAGPKARSKKPKRRGSSRDKVPVPVSDEVMALEVVFLKYRILAARRARANLKPAFEGLVNKFKTAGSLAELGLAGVESLASIDVPEGALGSAACRFADVKKLERATKKVHEYLSDADCVQRPAARYVLDLNRCTVVFDTVRELVLFYHYFKARRNIEFFQVKNKLADPNADPNQRTLIMINALVDAEHVLEVQLTLKDFLAIKKVMHPYYSVERAESPIDILPIDGGEPIFNSSKLAEILRAADEAKEAYRFAN